MDKTSKLFLESEIKRILNLNERIESNDFILENVTAELQKSLDELEKFLVDKLTIEPSLVGVDKNAKGVDEVKPFIDNIIYNNLLKPKQYCGGRGMVKCEDLVDYMKGTYTSNKDINDFKKVTEIYNSFKRDVEDLLKQGGSAKLSEVMKSTLGKKIKLNPYVLDDSEIDNYIGFFESALTGLQSRGIEVNFDSLNNLRDKLKRGTTCMGTGKTYCETEQEVKDSLEGEIKSISDMIKRLQKRLTPQEIEDKLSLFDSKLAPTLVNNQGEEWASKMRNSFGSMMKDGSICSDCETKDEVLDAVNREMAEMRKYSLRGEREAVNKMSDFLEKARNAKQIYKDFMDMWGLGDSDFGDGVETGNKKEPHKFTDGETIQVRVRPADSVRKELNEKLTSTKGNFSDLFLTYKVKSGGRGDIKHWLVSKNLEKQKNKYGDIGPIGLGVTIDENKPNQKTKAYIQKEMTSPGGGKNLFKTSVPVILEIK